ncbi:hypothetical protein OC834_001360 [Tilletia horrida]|uniref:Methyltransferase domain-containing protein n=1 Tax=Tilletia horrida TaxID=155126 RepID=A0AAN6GIB5_9BASI|nr:hypothetical protein OC835_006577 [Tilletia horrida]KAK0535916.1 hypothetical protein OC834_001360 [Tilletia horrida]KAK0539408.1 hypothetical protein OC842_000964 [Tilletia horrida]KAK0561490.1 hypothetical protein OC844_003190 [Tilletia horrida]
MTTDAPRFPERQSLPGSAERNTPAIVDALVPRLAALPPLLPADGRVSVRVLELASGTGAHVAAIARAEALKSRNLSFQPTEADAFLCGKIKEAVTLQQQAGRSQGATVLEPRILDLTKDNDWAGVGRAQLEVDGDERDQRTAAFDAVLAFNLLHITPFEVTHSIFAHLDPASYRVQQASEEAVPLLDQTHGFIAFYGAFKEHEDDELSEGNARFDADIRSRNPAFGIRSVDAVSKVAREHGYALAERIAMPANNWIIVFRPRNNGPSS